MIQESIEYIKSKLEQLNLFEKVYSQVEIVTDADGKSFPAVYSSNGKYEIIKYSLNNGTAYIRKDGNIVITESTEETYVGCKTYHVMVIPILIFAFKRKDKLPIDCSYSEDLLAETIYAQLTNETSDYHQSINAKKLKVLIQNINTNSSDVWKNETEKIEQIDVNYDIACISLTGEIQITMDSKCLTKIC